MSKRMWVLTVLAALLVASSGIGYAMPSLRGGTGVVSVPNALVAPVGDLQVAASYQAANASLVSGLETYEPIDDSYNVWSLQALAGVAEGAELWAAYSADNSDFDFSTWAIGGKYQFYTDPGTGAKFALGAAYRSGSGEASMIINIGEYEVPDYVAADIEVDANATDVYLAVTNDFASMAGSEWCPGAKLLGTAGLIWKNLDGDITATTESEVLEDSFDESLLRPFVALQWISADNTWLGLEYRWEDDDLDADPVFSAVLGHDFGNGFSGEVGTTNSDPLGFGLDDQDWFVQLGYTFNMGEGW